MMTENENKTEEKSNLSSEKETHPADRKEQEKSQSGLDEYLSHPGHDDNEDDDDNDLSVTESRLGTVRGYRKFLFFTGLMWLVLLVLEWLYPLFIYQNINSISSLMPNFLGGKIESFTLTAAGEIPHVFMTAFLATFCFLSFYSASQPRAKGLVLGMALSEFLLGGLFLLGYYSQRQPFFVFSLTGYFFVFLAVFTMGVFLVYLNRIPD